MKAYWSQPIPARISWCMMTATFFDEFARRRSSLGGLRGLGLDDIVIRLLLERMVIAR